MSLFEALMLCCFGAAWPMSIWKSWTSRRNDGKSLAFMFIVFLGYVSGTIHKFLYNLDGIVILYIANGVFVAIDMALYQRNARLARRGATPPGDGSHPAGAAS